MHIAQLETSVYRIPTDRPEADGTIAWDATTMVLVEAISDAGQRGLGYSYASAAAAGLVHELLEPVVLGCSAHAVRSVWGAMVAAVRNVGRPGVAATAISAVDVALWDLKARVAGQPLFRLLGPRRETVPVYGSGGFTTYTDRELADQLGGWVQQGIPRVKMKIGTDLERAVNRAGPRVVERLARELALARVEIRQGRFERSMALMTAFAAIVSGWEAYAQHLRGAFSHWLMWTPVGLTPPTILAAVGALVSRRAARRVLPALAVVSFADGVVGFVFHLRGIGRMPGGWKLGQYNVVMGPPIFAPLLTCTVGVVGLLAGLLRPEEARPPRWDERLVTALGPFWKTRRRPAGPAGTFAANVAHGRFQRTMALVSASFAILAGGEAYFEHLRGSFNRRLMWTPVWVTPPMAYLVEAIVTAVGGTDRWRTTPWLVVVFGLVLAGLALTSLGLVLTQIFLVHALCTLCLCSAAISCINAWLGRDEVFATLHALRRVTDQGMPLGRALHGDATRHGRAA